MDFKSISLTTRTPQLLDYQRKLHYLYQTHMYTYKTATSLILITSHFNSITIKSLQNSRPVTSFEISLITSLINICVGFFLQNGSLVNASYSPHPPSISLYPYSTNNCSRLLIINKTLSVFAIKEFTWGHWAITLILQQQVIRAIRELVYRVLRSREV